MKFRLAAFAICLFASGASAATLEELQSVRDAALAGECSELTRFQTHQVEHGELYQLPCRTTATGQMDVFVQKTSRGLELLDFPELRYRPVMAKNGLPDWSRAVFLGVTTVTQILDAHVAVEANLIRANVRLTPGAGSGRIETTYRLEESGPLLERTDFISDEGYYTAIWPKPQPRPQPALSRVEFSVDELTRQPVDTLRPGTLIQIVEQLELPFPEAEPEGAPNLVINASQYDDKLAVELRETGWADDSVSGQLTRLLLHQRGPDWVVEDMGTAWLCARGERRVSTTPCP